MSQGNGKATGGTIAVKAQGGSVIFVMPGAVDFVQLDAQTAFNFAEATARAAHEARFGRPPPDGADRSYLAGQVRARLTEQFHARMVRRASLMMNRLAAHNVTPAKAAADIVDAIFAEVDRQDGLATRAAK